MADQQALQLNVGGLGNQRVVETDRILIAGLARSAAGSGLLYTDDNVTSISMGGGTAVTTITIAAGATSDLTLTARGGSITLNQSGQTALDGNFVATSIVGALNELNNKAVQFMVVAPTTDVAAGDGAVYFTVPDTLNGLNLLRAQATVVTAGTGSATTVMVHNFTDTVDMLTGAISIADGATVGTVGTVDGTNDDVATDDILRIDVDSVASTTAPKGLMVILTFGL